MGGGFVKLQFASMVGNKKVFSNVALIIHDKESCISSNVDVYFGVFIIFHECVHRWGKHGPPSPIK